MDNPIGGFLVVAVTLGVYLLPAIIAASREHHQGGSIFVLNLLLGWTVLGWVIALIWSVSAIKKPSTA